MIYIIGCKALYSTIVVLTNPEYVFVLDQGGKQSSQLTNSMHIAVDLICAHSKYLFTIS